MAPVTTPTIVNAISSSTRPTSAVLVLVEVVGRAVEPLVGELALEPALDHPREEEAGLVLHRLADVAGGDEAVRVPVGDALELADEGLPGDVVAECADDVDEELRPDPGAEPIGGRVLARGHLLEPVEVLLHGRDLVGLLEERVTQGDVAAHTGWPGCVEVVLA